MPTRQAVAMVGAGLVMSAVAVGTAAPATAATAAPCTDLVGCATTTLAGTTGTLTTTVTGTLHTVATTTLPTVLTVVPTTLTSLLSSAQVSPPPKPPGKPTPGRGRGHGHPGTPAAVGTIHHGSPHARPASTSTSIPSESGVSLLGNQTADQDHLVWPVVAATVQKLLTLVGWNLLALVPMAGIAFVISRRMTAYPRIRPLRGR